MAYKNFEQLCDAKLTGEDRKLIVERYGTPNKATYRYRHPAKLCNHKDLCFFADLLGMTPLELFTEYDVARDTLDPLQIRELKKAAA